MSRMIHADDSAFSLCQDALLTNTSPPAHGVDLDQQLRQLRSSFQELCAIDARYTAAGCEFGYIHYKHAEGSPSGSGGKMVLYFPQQGQKRPRRYIGVDPRKQFETRARLARYEARTDLRLRFEEMHAKCAHINATLSALLEAAAQLQNEAEAYRRQASKSQEDMEKEHERTAQGLREQ